MLLDQLDQLEYRITTNGWAQLPSAVREGLTRALTAKSPESVFSLLFEMANMSQTFQLRITDLADTRNDGVSDYWQTVNKCNKHGLEILPLAFYAADYVEELPNTMETYYLLRRFVNFFEDNRGIGHLVRFNRLALYTVFEKVAAKYNTMCAEYGSTVLNVKKIYPAMKETFFSVHNDSTGIKFFERWNNRKEFVPMHMARLQNKKSKWDLMTIDQLNDMGKLLHKIYDSYPDSHSKIRSDEYYSYWFVFYLVSNNIAGQEAIFQKESKFVESKITAYLNYCHDQADNAENNTTHNIR